MTVIAVIPARGGSKGVPGKNLRPVGGVPLVARSVIAALGVEAIDQVVVSTDSVEIADVAREAGASIVERPAEISGDTAGSESALLHALGEVDPRERAHILVFIQATSPFIDTVALAEAVRRVADGDEDAVFSAVEDWTFLWRVGPAGAEGLGHDAAVRPRRQDREAAYAETGAFYVMRAPGFRDARHRFFGRVGLALVDPRTAIEIDTEDELEMAEALAAVLDADAPGEAGAALRSAALRGRAAAVDADLDDSVRADGGTPSTSALAAAPTTHAAEPAAAPTASRFAPPVTPIPVDAVVADFGEVAVDARVVLCDDLDDYVPADRADGRGVQQLRDAGVPMLLLSEQVRRVTEARAERTHVDLIHGSDDPAAALLWWAEQNRVELDRVAYLGTTIADLECLRLVGWPVATADAAPEVLAVACVVLDAPQGQGAVRELADRVLEARRTSTPSRGDAGRDPRHPDTHESRNPPERQESHDRRNRIAAHR
ncbi:acylneuraminate cytidylyltransferase [Schumannella soli]|uniref:N-acylneuraminate cytidylyltransferase n=1 Tax=Schumannella soli TaxID=2590779 RepID=A0A506XYJ8_9MICO|nr:acylneuraminate cytidylyltransferase [Schumannella soli]TPW78004.1 acylneuraminate cytidylyltransferase [Schumannella soli]